MPKKTASTDSLYNIRHSLAHLLAAAVLKKYPKTKLGVGPVIEHGFYYDFLLPKPISPEDLKDFEREMRALIGQKLPFKGKVVAPAEAKKKFKNQPFKLDLIKDFIKEKSKLTSYTTGDVFLDLCRGGHVKNTSEINPEGFKLTHLAGAYWKGDENNPQLTRIYGAAFENKKELEAHLVMLEEARKRDHRKLGKELDLFVFSDLIGPGLPVYTPRGTVVLNEIKNFSRSLRKEIGYEEVQSPQINKGNLFKISGHYDKYKDDMFRARSNYTEEEYFLKPMNCPQHTQVYASRPRSYKELPLRLADFAILYRDEKPGELSGLTRLRSFSQDDGHCFAREDQIEQEFNAVLGAIKKALEVYGLNYLIRLSLRDEKNKKAYLGDDKTWKKSQQIMRKLLKENKIDFVEAEGEAAFYGPKMDIIAKDSLGREWQISTIQLDLNMATRFGLEYIDEKGKKQTPVMIHSALVGSPERFLGILIEHYAGHFPVWLAPVQVQILPVSDKFAMYGKNILDTLAESGIRAELTESNESLGKRIREGELQKIPYLLIVGEKEQGESTVSVRSREKGQEGTLRLADFLENLEKRIKTRS